MKIAILIPAHGGINPAFVLSLSNMLLTTAAFKGFPITLSLFMDALGSSDLADLRERLLEEADKWGADRALFIDADQTFPPDALIRLAARQLPVVAANYVKRSEPTFPVAATLDDERAFLFTTKAKADAQQVEEAGWTGLGLFMVDMAYVRKAQRPWFEFAREADGRRIAEDKWFCRRLRAAGAKIYIDHALSWRVGHLFTKSLMNSDAIGARDAGDPLRISFVS